MKKVALGIGFFLCKMTCFADFSAKELISHVEESIRKAEEGVSKIDDAILGIDGMSSPLVRRFLNNVCSWEGAVYLEVGCYKGSTLVSALYQNPQVHAVGIDNWSQFDGSKKILDENLAKYVPQAFLRFYETNAFTIDPSRLFSKPVTIYFYDGDHSKSSQKRAFTHFHSLFNDFFIAVIDDWNWKEVREGTLSAFKELGYNILYKKEFYTERNGDTNSWWNGLCIAVVEKLDF